MDEDGIPVPLSVVAALVVGLTGVLLFALLRFCRGRADAGTGSSEPHSPVDTCSENEKESVSTKPVKTKALKHPKPNRKSLPNHPLLVCEFKGHTGSILSLDFDCSQKYLASCSEDRSVRLWFMKHLKEKEHKFARKNIDFDHATRVKFSPDGTAFLASLAIENSIRVFRITKSKNNLSFSDAVEFPKLGSKEIISIGIASTGKFVVTCTESSFTVWTVKGEVLSTIETHQDPNTCAVVSPCGKFIACAGFTPDVKVWEVVFLKSGDLKGVCRAMELKGHKASVLSISYSMDSFRVATVSKDKSLKLWDVDVRYHLQEDPKLLLSVPLEEMPSVVALSPDAHTAAVGAGTSIYIYSCRTGDLSASLLKVHGDSVNCLAWKLDSVFLASAGSTDRHIRVWYNLPGRRVIEKELQEKLSTVMSDMQKGRIQKQLEELKEELKSYSMI